MLAHPEVARLEGWQERWLDWRVSQCYILLMISPETARVAFVCSRLVQAGQCVKTVSNLVSVCYVGYFRTSLVRVFIARTGGASSEFSLRSLWICSMSESVEIVRIRPEESGDQEAIHNVHEVSFPSEVEARLVEALRDAGRLCLSLVAEHQNRILGHVGFSPVSVAGAADGLGLAPVAVLPEHRRRGIAARLVRAGLAACEPAGTASSSSLETPATTSGLDSNRRGNGACTMSIKAATHSRRWKSAGTRFQGGRDWSVTLRSSRCSPAKGRPDVKQTRL